MGDVARCICPKTSDGTKCGRNLDCPFHGMSSADPLQPYALTENDKRFLRTNKIAPFGSDEIEDVRRADENRFKP
jgi:hypothetical protein